MGFLVLLECARYKCAMLSSVSTRNDIRLWWVLEADPGYVDSVYYSILLHPAVVLYRVSNCQLHPAMAPNIEQLAKSMLHLAKLARTFCTSRSAAKGNYIVRYF